MRRWWWRVSMALAVVAALAPAAVLAASPPPPDPFPTVETWIDAPPEVPPDAPAGAPVAVGVTLWDVRNHDLFAVNGLVVKLYPAKGKAKPSVAKATQDAPGHLLANLTVPEGGAGRIEIVTQGEQCTDGRRVLHDRHPAADHGHRSAARRAALEARPRPAPPGRRRRRGGTTCADRRAADADRPVGPRRAGPAVRDPGGHHARRRRPDGQRAARADHARSRSSPTRAASGSPRRARWRSPPRSSGRTARPSRSTASSGACS